MKIGYARVSSVGQSLETQIEALKGAGCEKIYQEKESGAGTARRLELAKALDQLRAGDELVVTRIDRLARSTPDLYRILEKIDEAGASFAAVHQSGIDTNTPTGKLMLGILGTIAAFERDLIRERQAEGIAKAREKGIYRRQGRNKPKLDPAKVLEAFNEHGDRAYKILGCARSSVYRIVKEHAAELGNAGEPGEGIKALLGDPPGSV